MPNDALWRKPFSLPPDPFCIWGRLVLFSSLFWVRTFLLRGNGDSRVPGGKVSMSEAVEPERTPQSPSPRLWSRKWLLREKTDQGSCREEILPPAGQLLRVPRPAFVSHPSCSVSFWWCHCHGVAQSPASNPFIQSPVSDLINSLVHQVDLDTATYFGLFVSCLRWVHITSSQQYCHTALAFSSRQYNMLASDHYTDLQKAGLQSCVAQPMW